MTNDMVAFQYCNPEFLFSFFRFTKPGWVPILPVDGMKGEGRMHAFGVGEREKGGRGVSTFCRAIITAVQCLSFIICNDPACLSPFPLNPHWAVREGSSSPTQPSCSRCRQAGRQAGSRQQAAAAGKQQQAGSSR